MGGASALGEDRWKGCKVVQWVGEKRKAKYVIRKKMNCFAVIQLKK